MKSRIVYCCCLSITMLGVSTAAGHAQRAIASDIRRDSPMSDAMARLVTVQLDKVSVSDAIDALAANAKLRIQYRADVVDILPTRVTLRASRIPLSVALERVLAGTRLYAVPMSHDLVTVKSIADAQAVQQGTIIGKVIHSKTKEPLAGATVYIGDATSGVVTDASGAFRLGVTEGSHQISVRLVGFVRAVKTIDVQAGIATNIEIALDRSASLLDEVVVTGSVIATERKAIATPITVIHGDDLERRGITRIEQLFRGEIPGVVALDRGVLAYSTDEVGQGVRSTVFTRGSADLNGGANPLKTYIDGVELQDPSYLGTIDPRSIERIEIVTGPQAATIYGSGAMGGVMQIFTRRGLSGTRPEFVATLRYGVLQNSFSRGLTPTHNDALSVRGSAGATLSYSGNVSYDYSGQWQPRLYSRRYAASLGATHTQERFTVGASYGTSSSTQGTWNSGGQGYGLLQFFAEGDGWFYPGTTNMAVGFHSSLVSQTSNQTVSLNTDFQATPTWKHHVTIGRSQNIMALNPVAPAFTYSADTLFRVKRENGHRLTWNYNTSYVTSFPLVSSSLTVGANGSSGERLAVSGGQVSAVASAIVGDVGAAAPVVTLPMDSKSWGSFAQWRLGLFGALYTTFGLRVEQNPTYGNRVKFDFTPTNGLTYVIERGSVSLKMMGSYGRATRSPQASYRLSAFTVYPNYDPSQWQHQLANPDLRPEYSRGPQGGLEVYLGNRGSFTLNHYQQTITDLIQLVTVDSVPITVISTGQEAWVMQGMYMNTAKVRQQGWEGTGNVNVGPLAIRGTYSWVDNRVLSVNPVAISHFGIAGGATFQNIPSHTGNLSVGYARGATMLQLTTNYVGARNGLGREDRLYWNVFYGRFPTYTELNRNGRTRITSSVHHAGYAKSDFVMTHRVTSKLSVTANIQNVGNTWDSDISDLNPALGRQSTFGVSYRFGSR